MITETPAPRRRRWAGARTCPSASACRYCSDPLTIVFNVSSCASLLVDRQLRITDDVDEQDMPRSRISGRTIARTAWGFLVPQDSRFHESISIDTTLEENGECPFLVESAGIEPAPKKETLQPDLVQRTNRSPPDLEPRRGGRPRSISVRAGPAAARSDLGQAGVERGDDEIDEPHGRQIRVDPARPADAGRRGSVGGLVHGVVRVAAHVHVGRRPADDAAIEVAHDVGVFDREVAPADRADGGFPSRSSAHVGDHLQLRRRSASEGRRPRRSCGRSVRREMLGVESVERREVGLHVGQEHGHVDDVVPRRAGVLEDEADVAGTRRGPAPRSPPGSPSCRACADRFPTERESLRRAWRAGTRRPAPVRVR